MASKSDIEAGRAFVRFYIENSALTKGLAQIQQHLTGLGRGVMAFGGLMTGLGTSIIAPLTAAVLLFAQTGAALDDMSRRTGVAVETLDSLAFAAERSGTSLDTVEKAIRKAQQNGFAADQFGAIAAEIAAMGDHDAKVRRTFEIFGRQGAELIPMLEDLAALNAEFEKFGIKRRPEDIRAAAELDDALGDISKMIGLIAFQLGASLAPAIMPVLQTVKQISAAAYVWAQNNGETVQLIAAIGIGLVVAGTAAIALGVTLVTIGALVGSIMTMWTGLVAAVTFLATPLGIVVLIIGLIAAAIVVAIGYWLLFTRHGREFVRWLGREAKLLAKVLGDMFLPALKFLKAGQLEKAWKITALTMSTIWRKMIIDALTEFQKLTRAIGGVAGAALIGDGGLKDIANLTAEQKKAFAEIAKLRLEANKIKPSDNPNDPGYGLQDAGNRVGKVIGFSAQAAMLAGNIVGTPNAPEDKMVDRLDKILEKLAPAAAEFMKLRRALEGAGTFK